MEEIAKIIESLGLPVAMAVGFAWISWKLGNRMLEERSVTIDKKDFLIDRQNTIISNHLDHLTQAITVLSQRVDNTGITFGVGVDKIVNSVNHQTSLMTEILSRDCPLRGKDK